MRFGPQRVAVLVLGAGCLLAPAARAQVTPKTAEIAVTTTTSGSAYQAAPAVASDPTGDFVLSWQQQSAVTGGCDVFAQRYNLQTANGVTSLAAVGAAFQVNTTSGAGCRQAPAVAVDTAGDFVIVWQSDQGGSLGVFGQLYNGAGQPLGGEFQVNQSTAGNRQSPAVARAPDGRFLVAWQSDGGQDGGSSWGVLARAYNAGGSAASNEFVVNVTNAGAQHSPAVAYLAPSAAAQERFEVVWVSEGQDSGSAGAAGIFARAFSATGAALSGELAVNLPQTGAHAHPRIAADPSGNFVVAWESTSGAGSAVVTRRFNAAGTALMASPLAVDAAPTGAQRNPAVAADAAGEWAVAWDSPGQALDGDGAAVLAQQFTRLNLPQPASAGKVQLNVTTAGDQAAAGVAMTSGGSLVAAWQSQTPAADACSIAARAALLPAQGFFTVVPCRMVDTRNAAGPLGGPALTSGQVRNFPLLTSACATGGLIPATAKALSLNLTVTNPTNGGSLTAFPGDAAGSATSVINFDPAETIANNAVLILSLAGDGSLSVKPAIVPIGGTQGTVDFIVDVDGYFQ
jgi:hypothetical protein